MPIDLNRMFTALGADTDTTWLATPDQLREVGDRRRTWTAVGLVAVGLAVVAVVAVATTMLRPPAQASLQPATVPPVTTILSPTAPPGPTRAPAAITDLAFLQPADRNEQAALPDDWGDLPLLPELCDASYASQADIATSRTKALVFAASTQPNVVPEGTFYESITVYNGSSAEQFMAELRQAIDMCPSYKLPGPNAVRTYFERIDQELPGDESVSFTVRATHTRPAGGTYERIVPVYVVRYANAVVILQCQAWEDMGFDEQVVRTVRDRGLDRFITWARHA